jgi:serine protease AprX
MTAPERFTDPELKDMDVAVDAGPIIRLAIWRTAAVLAACALLVGLVIMGSGAVPAVAASAPPLASSAAAPGLDRLAATQPSHRVEVIVQLQPASPPATRRGLLRSLGATHVRDLPIVHGFAARMSAAAAAVLAHRPGVRAVTLNAPVEPSGSVDSSRLTTAYPPSINAEKVWNGLNLTGRGVGVAVIDTGIAGDVPDFRTSETDPTSRVVASVVTNPAATTATDTYGHGTHVAGILAGNGLNRADSDPLQGRYIGIAPNAHLVSVKASDDNGVATVLDVIYGLQFVVEHKADYNIRVVNLSLESTEPQSYRTDPLDAAVEAAWLHGLVVVAASGNRGSSSDSVGYAPGNDPYAISVGAVDDQGTKAQKDDTIPAWTSRGTTQDGFTKPDVLAPGAHIVAPLAPGSTFATLCPSCITDGEYIRAGGTSMAAPVVAGLVADMLQAHPDWTPDHVKAALMTTARPLPGPSLPAGEVVGEKAIGATKATGANTGLAPNIFVDGATGDIDYTRATWSRATWSTASELLRATWSRATWSCDCSLIGDGTVDPTRATWSRATWSTSWTK